VPFFFLSYARNDAQDPYLKKFFTELATEVAVRLGIDAAEAGFLDTNLPPGSLWAEATSQALATCKIFIPVYSPSFFQSGYCGKEWSCFSQRLAAAGASTELILPVWWLPVEPNLPDCASAIQDPRGEFGDAFREFGLQHVRRLRRNQDDYRTYLATLAGQAIAAARRHELGDGEVPDLLQAPDVFRASADVAKPAAVDALRRMGGGPKWVRFIVVAGNRAQMLRHRTHLEYYGDKWDAWRPYHPLYEDLIGVHAQRLAGEQRLLSSLHGIDRQVVQLVRTAEQQREIVVLILDSWAAKIDSYSALLEQYDLEQFDNAAIVVPTSVSDEETAAHLDQLRAELFKRMRRSMRNVQLFREDTSDAAAFDAVLRQVIVEVRRRIVEDNPPARRAGSPTEPAVPMPVISGTPI
jgi:FxsC-like protein